MKHFTMTALLGFATLVVPAIAAAQVPEGSGAPERFDINRGVSNESIGPRPQGDWLVPDARAAQPVGSYFRVDDHFARAAGEGCTYDTHVHGRMRLLRTRDETRNGQLRYRPDLRVDTSLRCANGVVASSSRRVRQWPTTGRRLQDTIERTATLTATQGDRACTYAPVMAMDSDVHLRTADVRISCTAPTFDNRRGGGPNR